jgi:hypothetical protein
MVRVPPRSFWKLTTLGTEALSDNNFKDPLALFALEHSIQHVKQTPRRLMESKSYFFLSAL